MYNFSMGTSKNSYNYSTGLTTGTKTGGNSITGTGGMSYSSGLTSYSTSKTSASSLTGGSYYGGSSQSNNTSSQKLGKASSMGSSGSGSTTKGKPVSADFQPKRFGLLYDPPTIILEYMVTNTGKLYHHKMKLLKLRGDSDPKEAVEYTKKKHAMYFTNGKISDEQVMSLVLKLQKRLDPAPSSKVLGSSNTNKSHVAAPEKPSSSLSEKLKEQQKSSTLTGFGKTSSNGFTSQANTIKAGAKKEENDIFDYAWNKKGSSTSNTTVPASNSLYGNNKKQEKAGKYDQEYDDEGEEEDDDYGNEYEEEEDQEDDDEIDYHNMDLNKLSNEELQKHKDKMSVLFSKNAKKPGDPGYKYDLQEDFNPNEENDWDMELDDNMDIV